MGLLKMRPASLLAASLLLVLAQRAASSPLHDDDYYYDDYYAYYGNEDGDDATGSNDLHAHHGHEMPQDPVVIKAELDPLEEEVEGEVEGAVEGEGGVEEESVPPSLSPSLPHPLKEEEVSPAEQTLNFETGSNYVLWRRLKRAIPEEHLAKANALAAAPVKAVAETPVEAPRPQTPVETPAETPAETFAAEAPVKALAQSLPEDPVKTPSEDAGETPDETPAESPGEAPAESPGGAPAESPAEEPAEAVVKAPAEIPAETPEETPAKSPEETPAKSPEEAPEETPAKAPASAPINIPVEEPDTLAETPEDPTDAENPSPETRGNEKEDDKASDSAEVPPVLPGEVPLPGGLPQANGTDEAPVIQEENRGNVTSLGDVDMEAVSAEDMSTEAATEAATTEAPITIVNATVAPSAAPPVVRGHKEDGVPIEFPERCTQPPNPGVCRGAFPKFYFDPVTRTCRQFLYGGCRGNENKYSTSAECYGKCYPQGHSSHSTSTDRATSDTKDTYLALSDGTDASILTFTGAGAAAKVKGASLKDFRINGTYQLQFYFRTDLPHGLVAFLRQESVPEELEGIRIQLYVYLKKGHLALTHIYGNTTESLIMNRGGLQGGNWHSAVVKVDSKTGEVVMEVDSHHEVFTFESLANNPQYTNGRPLEGFKSSLWIGGVFPKDLEREDVVLGIVPFHGCLQDVKLLSGDSFDSMAYVKKMRTSKHFGVVEHCSNNCNNRYENLCGQHSHCVEHFDHSTCSCFGSGKDGRRCTDADVPVLSLSGDGYVVHRLYEWMDRVHSYVNLISLSFKTKFTDSILFYASAEHPEKQHITASITRAGTVYVEVDLGDGPAGAEVGVNVNSNLWHTLTLVHQHEKIQVLLDHRTEATIIIPGEIRYFHLDPDFYVGNAPNLTRYCGLPVGPGTRMGPGCDNNITSYYYDVNKGTCESFTYSGCGGNVNRFDDERTCMDTCHKPGLRSFNTFLGCFEKVFFNDVSVLLELELKNKTTRYHGLTKETPLSASCKVMKFLPVTFSTENASVRLTNEHESDFHITISFKPTRGEGVLASGHVDVGNETTEWELWHDKHYVTFYIHDGRMILKPDAKIRTGHWQYVDIHYDKRTQLMKMKLNDKSITSKKGELPQKTTFSSEITIGSNVLDLHPGFVGCIRTLDLGGKPVVARAIVGTPMATKDVTFDNCEVLGPCERPNACEHGAQCIVIDDNISCNCTGTGYTGKTCHFSLYRRSCEQYRQIGYNATGIYKIDPDGNGPLPAAYVNCSYNKVTRQTTTVVVHNLPEDYLVRDKKKKDLQLELEYRDFTPDMLKSLISQSESCSQEIRYDCRRSPLKLSTRTWFASPSNKYFTYFGASKEGLCRCKELDMCDTPQVPCNCDVGDGVLRSDTGEISDPDLLPITSMTFLRDRDGMKEDTEGTITLSSLQCHEEASGKHTVSFTNHASFLEVPGWREGSLYLSFKTTAKRPVVAYQPANHPGHASFVISLAGDKELEFMYRYRDQVKRTVLTSKRRLNTGHWQQVRIEIHQQQMRVVLNSEEKLFDVDFDIVLDGSMYLGAIPEHVKNSKDDLEGLEGLVGCVRGLTLDDEVIDLKRYIRASAHGVVEGCMPSCDPNPCLNGGSCVEGWGTYQCQCANPYAHFGTNCETNINENAITFKTEEAKVKYFTNDTEALGRFNLLNNTFMLNFRTHDKSALILFAHDSLHNFVQLYVSAPDKMVFLFNNKKDVIQVQVEATNGVVFNQGQSVQVLVKRTSTCTTLEVFTLGQTFSKMEHFGLDLLLPEEYEQFPFGSSRALPDMVYYPHSLTKPRPYFQAYLGSANDMSSDVKCTIQGLVGCLRGLRIGDQDVSLPRLWADSSSKDENVKPDCKLACDQSPCKNGGLCTEDFRNVNNFQCDCMGTSYMGPSCVTESALTFRGDQWLSKASNSSIITDFTLGFAFSASEIVNEPQLILLLRSTDPSTSHDYLLVGVESDGSLLVEAQFSDLDSQEVHGAKLTPSAHEMDVFDGYRHHVVITRSASGWTLKVDGEERSTFALRNVYDSSTKLRQDGTYLYLGGIEMGTDERLIRYKKFHGCISNVEIDYAGGMIQPLTMTLRQDLHIARSSLPPSQGSCAAFGGAGAPSLLRGPGEDNTMISVFGEVWKPRPLVKMQFDAVVVPKGHLERNTPMDNVVPATAGVIFLIAIIIVLILLLRMGQKRRKKDKQRLEDEEKEALLNGKKPGDAKTTVFTITEKEDKPLKSAPLTADEPKDAMEMKEIPKFEEVPLTAASLDATDAAPAEADQHEQVRRDSSSSESPEDEGRLSWDKSVDGLPLILGQTQPASHDEKDVDDDDDDENDDDDDTSESSIECTIEITPSTPTTPTSSSHPDSKTAQESPSSTRVNQGSMLYIDEDAPTEKDSDDETSLGEFKGDRAKMVAIGEPSEEAPKEEDVPETKDGDESNSDEGEIDVVNVSAVEDKAEEPESPTATHPESQEKSPEDAAGDAKPEADAKSTSDSSDDEEAKPKAETEEPDAEDKEGEPDAEKESRADDAQEPEETQEDAQKEDAPKDKSSPGAKESSDSDSDDDFIELREERDPVQDARRMTAQPF